MAIQTVLMLFTALLSAATLACVLLLRADVRALRDKIGALPERTAAGRAGEVSAPEANPRLAAARKAAAERAARRPGRTSVKRI
jgi:hypothetical protein